MGGLYSQWRFEQANRTGGSFSRSSFEAYRASQLYTAAAGGRVACVDSLLDEGGADPDWLNPESGLTPLLVATMNGRAACASMDKVTIQ